MEKKRLVIGGFDLGIAADQRVDRESGMVALGNLVLNLNNFQVTIDGQRVPFTYQEFELLKDLADHHDHVVPLNALTNELWHATGTKYVRRLNVVVRRVRTKLVRSAPYSIESVRRRGYGLLQVPDETS